MLKQKYNNAYIPALSFSSLTPFYDPLLQSVMQEQRFKRRLVEQVDVHEGHRVLDFGCGTGTLTRMLARHYPSASIAGLDVDPAILVIAQRKGFTSSIQWICATATSLPFPDHSYDRVVTSLVLHHLPTEGKIQALAEIYRVLRPGGQLHVVDFGRPRSQYSGAIAPLMRPLEEVADNLDGLIPTLFTQAGFAFVSESLPVITFFGDIYLYALAKARNAVS